MLIVGVGWVILKRFGGGVAAPVTSVIGIAVIVAISLGVATLSYRFFEQPLARFAKRISQDRKTDPSHEGEARSL